MDDDVSVGSGITRGCLVIGALGSSPTSRSAHNGVRGDELMVQLKVENNTIADTAFSGVCYALPRAIASMTAHRAIERPLEHLATLDREFVLDLIDVPIAAPRVQCALLHLRVLRRAALGTRST